MSSTNPFTDGISNLFVLDRAQAIRDCRTPSLISFVGVTGAGKSTLIKLLIDLATDDTSYFPTPVIGATGAHLPTSEGVHLYMDPNTVYDSAPLLLADCEGLEGGEREPIAAKFKRIGQSGNTPKMDVAGHITRAIKILSERDLSWADEPKTRSRNFAVENLYPRLLYTFSDVIVYVLKEPRSVSFDMRCFSTIVNVTDSVIEHVFERLIRWAAAALEKSSNQPILPHAIIVLNASENPFHPDLWNPGTNTATILDSLANTITRNHTYREFAQWWRERGKTIDNLEQLVLCYYSSVVVLRVPANGRPGLMQEQVEKLYDGMISASIAARDRKLELRMLLDAEDFQSYLSSAFNHYAGTLRSPFDFVHASFAHSPIPPNFGGNILKLAIHIMDHWKDYANASDIFLRQIKGHAAQIFPNYIPHIDAALENFCDRHWPCEYLDRGSGARCVNVRSGHGGKGHQASNGKVIAAGEYLSDFSFVGYYQEFRMSVFKNLRQLLEQVRKQSLVSDNQERAAATMHKEKVLQVFHKHITASGGMRGIVELEALKAIERELGGGIPIRSLFDMVVGTSTGGIIALGLGVKCWSVDEALHYFETMCRKAFTPRKGTELWGIGPVIEAYHHSKYETKPLEDSLKEIFSNDELLFGGQHHTLTNDLPLKVYVDGAVYHNNPIQIAEQERKLMWPDLDDQYPDVVASLGTAFSPSLHRAESTKMAASARTGIIAHGSQLLGMLKNHMATSIQCERIWTDFTVHLPKHIKLSRFVRLDPELGIDVPQLDEVDHMERLQRSVRQQFQQDTRLKALALRLVATLFYWETFKQLGEPEGGACVIEGRILCRLPPGSFEMTELGKLLHKSSTKQSQLQFIVNEQNRTAKLDQAYPLTKDVIESMIHAGRFEMHLLVRVSSGMAQTEISLFFSKKDWFPISGFPRPLVMDKERPAVNRHAVPSSNRWAGGSLRSKQTRTDWTPPDLNDSHHLRSDVISEYANPTRGLQYNRYGMNTFLRHRASPEPGSHSEDSGPRRGPPLIREAFRALLRPVARPSKVDGSPFYFAELESNQPHDMQDNTENAIYRRYISSLSTQSADSIRSDSSNPHYMAQTSPAELFGNDTMPVELPGDNMIVELLDPALEGSIGP
ncbi:MAG: hypothetical protein Q9165_000488 [Trypethelium subeluteriae]